MPHEDLDQALIETIETSDLDWAVDLGEVGLDHQMDTDGPIREIPVLREFAAICKAGIAVRDRFFGKKLIKFLNAIHEMPADERQEQIAKMVVDVDERRKVGEKLLILLERANDMRKPELIAKAFLALLREQITYPQLWRLWHAIDVVDVSHLEILKEVYSPADHGLRALEPDNPSYHHLAICGLLMFDFGGLRAPSPVEKSQNRNTLVTSSPGGFRMNVLGQLFVQHLL